jgi:hypothetical protein
MACCSIITSTLTGYGLDKEGIVQGVWLPNKQSALFASDPILERAREVAGKP